MRVLIVEDSEPDAALIVRQLQRDGYKLEYLRVENAHDLEKALDQQDWDILLSDYILPQFSGLEVLKLLQRKRLDIPCVILSGKITDETAVAAMKAGARDYVMKDNLKRLGPVVERELTEAANRRQQQQIEKKLQEINEFNARLLQYAPNPIVVVNLDGSLRYINPAMEALTGLSGESLVGTHPPFPWWPPAEQQYHAKQRKKDYGQMFFRKEKHFVKKNGEDLWVEVTSIPIKDRDNNLQYVLYSWVDVTEQRRLNQEMEYYLSKVTEVQEDERRRIARELHDGTAQALSILALEIDAILQRDKNLIPDTIRSLKKLKENVERALDEVRRFSHELRPGVLDQLGLYAAIEQLISDVKDQMIVDFEVNDDSKRLSPDIELALFRIVQESLNNIRKHAGAEKVLVKLYFSEGCTQLIVRDNGVGFNKQVEMEAVKNGHLGLIGMKERARLIGAELQVKSAPGKGTTISVELNR